MNYQTKKILSLFLIVIYLITSLGFVISKKNCKCCSVDVKCEVVNGDNDSCCKKSSELPACCDKKSEKHQLSKKNCNCEQFKCIKSEYFKNDHKTISAEIVINLLNIKNFFVDTIVIDPDNKICEFLHYIKNYPPPILFKDSSFIIEISQLKIPYSKLV